MLIKSVENVSVTPSLTPYRVDVSIPDMETKELLDYTSIGDVVDYYGATNILNCIGMEEIQDYINSKK